MKIWTIWIALLLGFLGAPGVQGVHASDSLETATFAAGCFWGTEEFFRKIPGVLKTRVGYEGGKAPASYDQVSAGKTGHAESLEIKFDPKKISYRDLLILFFKIHDPTTPNRQGNDHGSQYRSAIFYHSEQQKKTAQDVIKKVTASGKWMKPIVTEVNSYGEFWNAEDYHQKYLVKHPTGYTCHFYRNFEFE